ncbi:MAG TPA: efflux RND transporter periplasmic adaptor subunit [Bryobacteraceae bacterium]|nr:efflux RND transporter periplasmic adaptor subunit [Bryobacteraceae bacterium]
MNPRIFGPLVIAAGLALAGCSGKHEQAEAATTKAPEPIQITTAAAESRKLDKSIAVTGSLHPDESVAVGAEVPGRVSAIHVDFGQSVRKGQVIAELDKQELTLALDRSKAALAQALARLGLDPGQENVRPDTTPAIRQATAQMEDAKSKFENASRLVKTGDISQERFTEVQKVYQSRQAALDAARDDARTLIASVQALQAEAKLAQKRLNDATVRAPFDGSVEQRLVSPGAYLKENTPILTLVKTNPLRLRVDLPESAVSVAKTGATLTFTTDAAPGETFTAIVRQLNPSVDEKSRTLVVEARIPRNDPRLRPGMFVQVQLSMQKAAEVVMVPKNAIYTVAGLNKLFVIREGRTVEQKIAPGQELEGWVEVPHDAVNPGEQVATSALAQLVTGTPVRTSGSTAAAPQTKAD